MKRRFLGRDYWDIVGMEVIFRKRINISKCVRSIMFFYGNLENIVYLMYNVSLDVSRCLSWKVNGLGNLEFKY